MLNYDLGIGQAMNWIIEETNFNERYQGKCESIMALGNGYMGLRSVTEESYIGQTRNLFISGTYNKFDEKEVTELPNAADITEMVLYINDELFSLKGSNVREYSRQLNLKTGELSRELIWEDNKGENYKLIFRRFISLDDLHFIGIKIEIIPLTANANINIKTGINARQTNSGSQHFHDGDKRVYENKYMQLVQTTTQSKIDFVINSMVRIYINDKEQECKSIYSLERRSIYSNSQITLNKGESLTIEKYINVFTSLDSDIKKSDLEELKKVSLDHIIKNNILNYEGLYNKSISKWSEYWKNAAIDIQTKNDFDQLAVRFAQYHLIIMTPFHDERYSIGAKALTGEGYKGHVFWDTEIFILPYFQYTFPLIAKKLLKYRFNTIDGARNKAKKFRYSGAMYPWETAFTGEEETPEWAAINVMTGKAAKIWSGLKEHHITADIAFAIWNYYLSTNDEEFLSLYGGEIIFECAEFWYSRLEWNEDNKMYHINDVIGPDEYTEHINNNSYTNYMAHLTIKTSIDLYELSIGKLEINFSHLKEKLQLKQRMDRYRTVVDKIYLPRPNEFGIIPQDDTFLTKDCISIEKYKNSDQKQGILKDFTREQVVNLQVLKQADVVMLLYLLRNKFDKNIIRASFEYYEKRTIHDSSLSAAAHSIVANDLNFTETAYKFFREASEIDLGFNLKSSDEGIHSASMGGIWMAVVMGFAGFSNDMGTLNINPSIPKAWEKLSFNICWKGEKLSFIITKQLVKITKISEEIINITILGELYTLSNELIVYIT